MFQFTAFARESRDHRLFVNSPEHFADFHAHHSHLMPRHPPYALSSLATLIKHSLVTLLRLAPQAQIKRALIMLMLHTAGRRRPTAK